ncbi:LAFE_0A03180g1_1 [Lachancea fermentati]|uniref:LAFE_0A03180g1_1 n=1 Tax=Lachancea fermentati TaxID=4955 RepID=A0A1G4M6X6_LACFM|nr:LAFE_0A03180g1_1 [Lachancea fermentati]
MKGLSIVAKRYNSILSSAIPSGKSFNSFFPNTITKVLFNKGATTITFTQAEDQDPKTVSFSNLFLRDSSRSKSSIEASSGQKLFTTGELLLNPKSTIPEIVEVTENKKGLYIKWGDGDEYTYPLNFISRYAGISENAREPNPVLWDKALLKSNIRELVSIDFHSFMDINDSDKLYQTLINMKKYGISFITNVPKEATTGYDSWYVKQIAERIGHIRHTFYGETFDVINKPMAENIAYTNVPLPLHQDLLYLDNVPGWQLLHAIKNSSGPSDSGMNLFVDSFNAARYVRDVDGDAYEALTHVPINYIYNRDDKRYFQSRPLVAENEINADNINTANYSTLIKEINYSPPFQAPFSFGIWEKPKGSEVSTPVGKMTQRLLFKDFARGLSVFEKFIRAPENTFRVKLPENTCVIFNNRRILHARTAFEGERWLKGCYIDDDTVQSKYRLLAEKYTK